LVLPHSQAHAAAPAGVARGAEPGREAIAGALGRKRGRGRSAREEEERRKRRELLFSVPGALRQVPCAALAAAAPAAAPAAAAAEAAAAAAPAALREASSKAPQRRASARAEAPPYGARSARPAGRRRPWRPRRARRGARHRCRGGGVGASGWCVSSDAPAPRAEAPGRRCHLSAAAQHEAP
ncbi:unnamed protein product, partial [Prorocentrum cordatum]